MKNGRSVLNSSSSYLYTSTSWRPSVSTLEKRVRPLMSCLTLKIGQMYGGWFWWDVDEAIDSNRKQLAELPPHYFGVADYAQNIDFKRITASFNQISRKSLCIEKMQVITATCKLVTELLTLVRSGGGLISADEYLPVSLSQNAWLCRLTFL